MTDTTKRKPAALPIQIQPVMVSHEVAAASRSATICRGSRHHQQRKHNQRLVEFIAPTDLHLPTARPA